MCTTLVLLGRSVFLAGSWTWVIGMFLPVLLIRDFGGWSFAPFAIANVLGAMSVGFVLSAKRAEHAYNADPTARALFSVATIAFHVFFVAAMSGRHLPGILGVIPTIGEGDGQIDVDAPGSVAVLTIVMLMIPYAVAHKDRPEWVRLSLGVAVYLVSLACAYLAYITAGDGNAYAQPPMSGEFGPGALAFASTGIIFGFALCPYLDQSIVRIRSITPGVRGRVVSALGFGLFFLAMIVFTLAYARAFLGGAWLSYYFLLHILVQSLFTVGVHMGELRRIAERHARMHGPALFWGALLACIAAAGLGLFTHPDAGPLIRGDAFVFVYRAFLSLYGVVFPLYVWSVMTPVPGLRGRSRGRRLVGFWVGLALSSGPFAWGFLGHVWWLIALGVGLALIAPIAVCIRGAKHPHMPAETRGNA